MLESDEFVKGVVAARSRRSLFSPSFLATLFFLIRQCDYKPVLRGAGLRHTICRQDALYGRLLSFPFTGKNNHLNFMTRAVLNLL